MHRHKAVARIFLFLAIVNFTSVGLAQTPTMHEMHVDFRTGAEDMAGVSETEHTQSQVFPELLQRPSMASPLHSRLDPIPAPSSSSAANPEEDKFFSEELIRRMKEYLILGAISGVFVGIGNGLQKQIMGTVAPNAYVISFTSSLPPLLPTLEWRGSQTYSDYGIYLSQTVGRSVEDLNKRSEDQEDLLSRSLSSMRDEDLQMLSVMSRRMLNSLDQETGS